MSAPDNPLLIVYDALWELASRHKPLARLVQLENRIRFDEVEDRDPIKEQVSENDLPELMLRMTSAAFHLQRTSNTTTMVQNYEWTIATGDLRAHANYDVNWELFRAMSKWETVMNGLTWRGYPLIIRSWPLTSDTGISDKDLNRGAVGWTTIWNIATELKFPTLALQGD